MAKKRSVFKRFVVPSVVILGFVAGMYLIVDEMVASQGEFRLSLWDILNGRGELPQGRAEVSQQVAIEVCRQIASREFGRNLLQSNFDQRSSRYNGELKVHTIFIDLIVKDKERDQVYIRCDISAVNRMVIETRIKGSGGFGISM